MSDTDLQADAQQRLVQSRQRLRDALAGVEPPLAGAKAGSTTQPPHTATAGAALGWLPRLAFSLGNRALAPTATRHPWWLVLGAAAVGAAMAAGRPWRWAPQALLAAGALRPWWQPMLLQAAARLTQRRFGPATAERR